MKFPLAENIQAMLGAGRHEVELLSYLGRQAIEAFEPEDIPAKEGSDIAILVPLSIAMLSPLIPRIDPDMRSLLSLSLADGLKAVREHSCRRGFARCLIKHADKQTRRALLPLYIDVRTREVIPPRKRLVELEKRSNGVLHYGAP